MWADWIYAGGDLIQMSIRYMSQKIILMILNIYSLELTILMQELEILIKFMII